MKPKLFSPPIQNSLKWCFWNIIDFLKVVIRVHNFELDFIDCLKNYNLSLKKNSQ